MDGGANNGAHAHTLAHTLTGTQLRKRAGTLERSDPAVLRSVAPSVGAIRSKQSHNTILRCANGCNRAFFSSLPTRGPAHTSAYVYVGERPEPPADVAELKISGPPK